jgi:protease IV
MKSYFSWLVKVITLIILTLVIPAGFLMLLGYIGSQQGEIPRNNNTVAVLELVGPIMDTKELVTQLYEQAYDDTIKGIVLRIDSPGGAVAPSQEVYNAVKTLKERKPIVVSMGSVAASGGLFAALEASKIVANEGTITGSIGVIMQFPNLQGITEKLGINMITVKSGKLKDVGNPFRSMVEEEREFLETTIDSVHKDFINAVAKGRKIAIKRVEEFADGRIITGEQAKELGLIDSFGGVHDAARIIFELLEKPLPQNELPNLYYPKDKLSRLKELLSVNLGFPLSWLGVNDRGVKLYYGLW